VKEVRPAGRADLRGTVMTQGSSGEERRRQ
jgi:hypothetical protein